MAKLNTTKAVNTHFLTWSDVDSSQGAIQEYDVNKVNYNADSVIVFVK